MKLPIKDGIVWLLLAGVVFGWYQTQMAKARAEGREQAAIAQRDSVMAVHDSVQTADSLRVIVLDDSLSRVEARLEESQVVSDSLLESLDSVLVQVTDTLVREHIRVVIDTLQTRCFLCENALAYSKNMSSILQRSLNTEKRLHLETRALLKSAQERHASKRITLGVTFGVGGYTQDGVVRVAPGVMVGVQIRLF